VSAPSARPSSSAPGPTPAAGPRHPAVFFDRDGVLNASLVRDGRPHPPRSLDELRIVPGAAEGLAALAAAGFRLIVVSNQPDTARGTLARETADAINAALHAALPALDEILTCYDDGDTPRRKPNPGMLLEAAARHGIDPKRSYLVGDRWKDIEAGRRAGCRTILIDQHYDEPWPAAPPDVRVDSLPAAIAYILRNRAGGTGDQRQVRSETCDVTGDK